MPIDFNGTANAIRNVNTGNLGADPRLVARMSSSLRKCQNFGRAWDVGDQGTVYYPFKWWPDEAGGGTFEMHMSAYFGHKVSDMKVLGTTFLRSMSAISLEGQVIGDGDLAYQFSRIAPLLINAQKEKELAEMNKKDWTVLGQTAYQTARDRIMDAYDTKKNMNAKRALIGKLDVLRLTEVVYVEMDSTKATPYFDGKGKGRTGNYIQTISEQRLQKLRTLANDVQMGILAQNPGLQPEPDKVYFLEVLYNFTSSNNSRTEAGKADPQGIAPSLTLVTRDPSCKAKLEELLQRIPNDPEGISAHAYNMAPMPEEVLMKKLQGYVFDNTEAIPFLSPDDKDRLVRNAKLLDYLRIALKEDPELNDRMTEALGHPIGKAPVDATPTLESIMSGDGNPDFSMQPKLGKEGDLPFTMGGEDLSDTAGGTDLESLLGGES